MRTELPPVAFRALVVKGALARLAEIKHEVAGIYEAIPELAAQGAFDWTPPPAPALEPPAPAAAPIEPPALETAAPEGTTRAKRPLSNAQRKVISARMKRYWAGRRASKG